MNTNKSESATVKSCASFLIPVCDDCGLEQLSIHALNCHCCGSKLIKLVSMNIPSISHIDLNKASDNFKKLSEKERQGVFRKMNPLKKRPVKAV